MKVIFSFLVPLFFFSCASGKERVFIGSTPADAVVRSFLQIPFKDSIDFIRWKISLEDDQYSLQCNYGIGKNNTNGFINGGTWVKLNGGLKKEKNYYHLKNGNRSLQVLELNSNLLHLLNEDESLLVGNGGWSYTLNSETPVTANKLNVISTPAILKDSMAFQGRTPCLKFANIGKSTTCYKLKWWIVLYADAKTNKPATYYIKGTAVRHNGKTGTWTMNTEKDGRIIYKLHSDNNEVLHLLKIDDNILVFTDQQGKLLVGDEDFSYSLNKVW